MFLLIFYLNPLSGVFRFLLALLCLFKHGNASRKGVTMRILVLEDHALKRAMA
jgi:hypothetical protein